MTLATPLSFVVNLLVANRHDRALQWLPGRAISHRDRDFRRRSRPPNSRATPMTSKMAIGTAKSRLYHQETAPHGRCRITRYGRDEAEGVGCIVLLSLRLGTKAQMDSEKAVQTDLRASGTNGCDIVRGQHAYRHNYMTLSY